MLAGAGPAATAQTNTDLPPVSPSPAQQVQPSRSQPSSPFNFQQFNQMQGFPQPVNATQQKFVPQQVSQPQIMSDNDIRDPFVRGKMMIRQATQMITNGQLDPAIDLLQKSMQLRKIDPTPQFLLGLIYDQKGNLQAALSNYTLSVKKATALGMDSSQLRINLGNTLLKLNFLKEAEFDYKRAIEIDDANEIAHLNYGRLLLFKADYAGSFKELQRAHELMATDLNLPLYEALALKGLGNVEESRQQLQVFLARAKGTNCDPRVINMAEKLLSSMQ